MSKYSVDFDITSAELLPIHKRTANILNIMYSLASPLNELSTTFTYLREGTATGDYNVLTVYSQGDLVNYQRRVYFKNEITIDYVAGVTPNTVKYFTKVLDSTIGLNDRIRFTPQKLVLEYALNAIFGTAFNQPPVLSDIYIVNQNTNDDAFFVTQLDEFSSTVAQTDANSDWFVTQFDSVGTDSDFIVYVPIAVWTALAGTSTERNNIILSVVNKYKLFGYIAEIQTY